ncbi:hypothetical protein MTO96_003716 [Rhipicephalus appendiculatus]
MPAALNSGGRCQRRRTVGDPRCGAYARCAVRLRAIAYDVDTESRSMGAGRGVGGVVWTGTSVTAGALRWDFALCPEVSGVPFHLSATPFHCEGGHRCPEASMEEPGHGETE